MMIPKTMTKSKFENFKKRRESFIKEFLELCEKYQIAIQSDNGDYSGLEAVEYREDIKTAYLDPLGFGRYSDRIIERDICTE